MTLPVFSIKTMIFNIILFYSTLILGGYILWVKSVILFILYSGTLIITIITGRYIICRACFYYGKPCPSFGFSYLALIFPKVNNKAFNGRAALIETRVIGACLILPIFSLILSWLGAIKTYSGFDNLLIGIYIVLLASTSIVHTLTGCDKCEIKNCPLSKG